VKISSIKFYMLHFHSNVAVMFLRTYNAGLFAWRGEIIPRCTGIKEESHDTGVATCGRVHE
jgi:hypothetical protein